MKNKLDDLKIEELHSLYSIVNELCSDFAKMTDNYGLATGNYDVENMPEDMANLISQRQKFMSYKLKLKDELIQKISKEIEKYE